MDRLLSEQEVKKWLERWIGYLDEDMIYRMKIGTRDIPSAEPREVLYSGDGYADGEMVYDMAECMNCGREFDYGDETWGCKFCPDCGQALKWEGEEE